VIGTLAVDGWAVAFGIARRGLGVSNATAHPSTASVPTSYYSIEGCGCGTIIAFGV